MNVQETLAKRLLSNSPDKYKKFGLNNNPFPKSGTANINESSEKSKYLEPIDDEVTKQVIDYVYDSLYSNSSEDDYKLIATITGDYGTGKTQLLMFAKYLIQSLPKEAYVIYIDNPGSRLSELIGSILAEIGNEQFKKYLWSIVISAIEKDDSYMKRLETFISKKATYEFAKEGLFSKEKRVNHKEFLESFLKGISTAQVKKHFNSEFRQIILQILAKNYGDDQIIANYFYDIISEDLGVNKSWETIVSGLEKSLDKKAVKILNAIIDVVQDQGFERFYILVDEFEDITSGRLTKKELDNYSHNLRALIDRARRWCVLFAMTSEALDDLRKISPPLVDRITDKEIKISRLTDQQAQSIFVNYLNLARETEIEDFAPFTAETISYLNSLSKQLPRIMLRSAYSLLERATEQLKKDELITVEFTKKILD